MESYNWNEIRYLFFEIMDSEISKPGEKRRLPSPAARVNKPQISFLQ